MQDRGHDILAVGVFFLTASWAIFLLRFCSRLRLVKHFKVDDWSLVIVQVRRRQTGRPPEKIHWRFQFAPISATLANLLPKQLVFTLYLACQIGSAVHGSGRHESDLTDAEKSQALKWWYFTCQAYVVATCTLKVFIGIFLIRIAVNRRHLLALHILTWGTLLFGIPYSILMIIQCRPIDTFWNISPRAPGKCWDYRVMQTLTHVASSLNCFADWILGIIPFFIVRSLNITRPTKALVAWLLCFAAIGSAATIIRTFFLPRMVSGHDFLYKTVDLCIWSTVEVGVGVLAWSASVCRPIHRYFLAKIQEWPWIGGFGTFRRRLSSRDVFVDFPVRDMKLRPDEYYHESRCSSNGGGSTSRTAKRKGSFFVSTQEISDPLSIAEGGGITRTLELTQITSRHGALFPCPPEAAFMPHYLSTSDEYASVPTDSVDKPRSRLASVPFHGTRQLYTPPRRCAIVPTKSMRNAPVSYWPKTIFKSRDGASPKSPNHPKTDGSSPLHLMSGSIDSGHCSILEHGTLLLPAARPRGWSIPHHGSTGPSKTNTNNKNNIITINHRSTGSLVSPRQSVVAAAAAASLDEHDSRSLRWSTASEASCYNSGGGGHNQLRDTFEPLGLSAPPRAAFLRRCSHLKPPVFQPIKWRRSRGIRRAAARCRPICSQSAPVAAAAAGDGGGRQGALDARVRAVVADGGAEGGGRRRRQGLDGRGR
ncbi:uncharacterized protein PG986_003594 [Apiospora aurea]|uniref:Rhodopsin domain-containing protein n=1 Tax=Apiospora aurea TaxID=335848 RepID=A0ABR1QS38_9PEZI